jgi:hypothetical protein
MSRRLGVLYMALAMFAGSRCVLGGEKVVQLGPAEVCVALSDDSVSLWGQVRVDVAVRNNGDAAVIVPEPRILLHGVYHECDSGGGGWWAAMHYTVEPGDVWFYSRTVGAAIGADQTLVGSHDVSVEVKLDEDSDHKMDRDAEVRLKLEIESPPESLVEVAERFGREVEQCDDEGRRRLATRIDFNSADEFQAGKAKARMGSVAKDVGSCYSEKLKVLRRDDDYRSWLGMEVDSGVFSPYQFGDRLEDLDYMLLDSRRIGIQSYEERYKVLLPLMVELGAGAAYDIEQALPIMLERGRAAALSHLTRLAGGPLLCSERRYLDEVRKRIEAVEGEKTVEDIVYHRKPPDQQQ